MSSQNMTVCQPNPITWQAVPPHLTLDLHEVHIWQHDLRVSTEKLADDQRLLSTEELAIANRFVFAKHRRRYTTARAKLRKLLAHYGTIAPQALIFDCNAHGKPQLIPSHNLNHLTFSVSHSHELACYAVTRQYEIGIDLEWIRPLDYLGLAKRFFADAEYQALMQLPESQLPESFFRVWTQKEAFVKAIGLGLSYPLDQFCVNATRPAGLTWIAQGDHPLWTMQELPLAHNYCCHLATPQSIQHYQGWQ